MEAVNLIAQKRCGKIKGRTCANGARQRRFVSDDDSFASPTASLEAILTTLMIDAYEERDVTIPDVPGAYLHAEFSKDKRVILKLNSDFVDIMCDVNPECGNHVIYKTNKKGRKTKYLYVKVLRALYGCLESALLWYDLYSSTLQKLGFILNDYDKCVANKIINGKQCTVVFNVDDNKISHADPEVVTSVINDISKHFGKLTVSRGKKHDYLGMNIELKDRKVHIEMRHQLLEALEWGGKQKGRMPATSALSNLFDQKEDDELLPAELADTYHSVVQKLMYVCKCARPDIKPALSYLCTKVSNPSVCDQDKLFRLLDFIKNSLDDKRVIGTTSLERLITWVDAAFATHVNERSHTGGTMSFGVVVIHPKSSKQKLNTKSSTEAELVDVSEYLPYHIWVDIQYFFIKDRVKSGAIEVEYCPTDKMVADFFTKPLQGSMFSMYRKAVMGHDMGDLIDNQS